MMKRWTGALAAVAALAAPSAVLAAAVSITTCGGTIPAGQRGVLRNDVVCEHRCSGDPSVVCSDDEARCGTGQGVCEPEQFVLENGATLDLDGHTIHLAYQASAAICGHSFADRGRCTVKGPGVLAGRKGTAVAGRNMNVVVKNVTIGFCDSAIHTRGGLRVDGVTILGDRENQIFAAGELTLRDSVIDGESGAYSERDVVVDGVEIGRGGIAAAGMVRGRDLLLDRSGGVTARDVVLRRATAVADEYPPDRPLIAAERRLRLVDSDVVGIESGREPVLVRSTCDVSRVLGGAASWGVCADD